MVRFFLGEFNAAIQLLKLCLKHDTSSIAHYLLSKSLWHIKEFHESLEVIEKALVLIQTSRNFFQKSVILNPYLEENESNDLVSKSLYLENVLLALNQDSKNLEAYREIQGFIVRENFALELPTVDVFKEEIQKKLINKSFFNNINKSIKKHKRKLIQCSVQSDHQDYEADIIDGKPTLLNDEDMISDDDILEEELFEDFLDEFYDDETGDYY